MRVVYEYSHLGGAEILQLRYPDCQRDIYEVISEIKASKTKISKERTKLGRELYAPIEMNRQFHDAFAARGYHDLRDTYTITIPEATSAFPAPSSKWTS